jgi:hypothetical protein
VVIEKVLVTIAADPVKLVEAGLPTVMVIGRAPKTTFVADDEIASYVLSVALVAVTTQVCAELELNSLPLIEQPFVGVVKVTAPPPVPPSVVSASAVPKVPVVEVIVKLL